MRMWRRMAAKSDFGEALEYSTRIEIDGRGRPTLGMRSEIVCCHQTAHLPHHAATSAMAAHGVAREELVA